MKGHIRSRKNSKGEDRFQYIFSQKAADGTRKQITKSGFLSYEEAAKALELAIKEIRSNPVNTNELTFNMIALDYLEGYIKPHKSSNTYTSFVYKYNKYIYPVIGEMKISDITTVTINSLLAAAKNLDPVKPLSSKSVKGIYSLINSIFNKAIKCNIVAFNPCTNADKIRVEKTLPRIFSAEDIALMLSSLNLSFHTDYLIYAIINILLHTGLRRGELLGLTWSDINFTEKTLSVRHQLTYNKGKVLLSNKLKSNSSYRVIPLSTELIDILAYLRKIYHKNRQALGNKYIKNNFNGKNYDFVFVHEDGKVLHPLWPWKQLKKLFLILGLNTDLTLHDFRHTFASNYIKNSNGDICNLTYILGHSSTSFTLDKYCHYITQNRRNTMLVSSKILTESIEAAKKVVTDIVLTISINTSYKKKLRI
ncbi:tyrosine-type recombinase/integrase [Clostridium disporicum]|uniref:Prophage LambdaBa04, site-specific recombinase, phage integrase family n=1 Tax=Clostridium disporicum TaxID=84024 RepID=A0A174JJ40_9CLOT|nr:tyrosine-type recombinase/integrase [Clostridium disporicum]CUO98206.1 prophage LambdaBa04%2C site-specific recombinase%2C phage integrase family [Clostridium disporicum]